MYPFWESEWILPIKFLLHYITFINFVCIVIQAHVESLCFHLWALLSRLVTGQTIFPALFCMLIFLLLFFKFNYLKWEDQLVIQTFWDGEIHLQSELPLLLAACIKTMEEGSIFVLCLLALTFPSKFTPSLELQFISSRFWSTMNIRLPVSWT